MMGRILMRSFTRSSRTKSIPAAVFSVILAMTVTVTMTFTFTALPVYAASGTPISTADDLKAMVNDPSGSYYLTQDITVPADTALFTSAKPFKGTLDGNGHALKGYTATKVNKGYCGIILSADNATFKDIEIDDVNINVTSSSSYNVGTLTAYAYGCTFTDVEASGSIRASGTSEDGITAGGIAGAYCSSMKNCDSDVDISVSGKATYGALVAAGLSGSVKDTISGCENSGDISVSGTAHESMTASGITGKVNTASSCKNSGAVSISSSSASSIYENAGAAGIVGEASSHLTSCGNTGKISNNCGASSINDYNYAAGLAGQATYLTKCYNKGAVTFTGKAAGQECMAGGLVGYCAGTKNVTSQNYNKGKVSAALTSSSGLCTAGGIASIFNGPVNNNYNVGTVSVSGNGRVGGLAGYIGIAASGKTASCNYNGGKVSTSKGTKGSLFGYYTGADVNAKRNIYNNYYKGSLKPYGASDITWHKWTAKATKVSSFTKKKCPKLSSKYWKYSGKYKRLILKNNAEK